MIHIELNISREHRAPETLCLEGSRILIGHGGHCDVRLATNEADFEHAVLELDGEGITVTELGAAAPVKLEGALAPGRLPLAGGGVRIGGARIGVTASTEVREQRSSRGGLKWFAAALLVVGGGALLVLFALLDGGRAQHPLAAPRLWRERGASCPVSDADEAFQVMLERRAMADAKAQRQPFVARDGVDAVDLYRVAASCAKLADAASSEQPLTRTADALRESIEADFRIRRLRLDYSMKQRDKQTALAEVAMLRDLLRDVDDPYTRWLSALSRRLSQGSPLDLLAGVGR